MNKTLSPRSRALSNNHKGYLDFLTRLGSIDFEMGIFKQDVLSSLLQWRTEGNIIHWLDVGGGAGDSTIPVLDYIENHTKFNLEYAHLDYLPSIIDVFKTNILTKNYRNVNIITELANWEYYSSFRRYDIVSFIHSAYYLGSISSIVSKTLESLNTGGIIFIANLGLHNGIDSHYSQIYQKIYGVGTHDIDTILSEFENRGAIIKKMYRQENVLDLYCIKRSNISEYKRIISFLTDREFNLHDESIVLSVSEDGKLVFPLSVAIVMLR
jgi:hypothetical protein